jgi:hypothetical protein
VEERGGALGDLAGQRRRIAEQIERERRSIASDRTTQKLCPRERTEPEGFRVWPYPWRRLCQSG